MIQNELQTLSKVISITAKKKSATILKLEMEVTGRNLRAQMLANNDPLVSTLIYAVQALVPNKFECYMRYIVKGVMAIYWIVYLLQVWLTRREPS